MKAIKGLVAFLALLLVVGLGVLGYGLSTKAHLKTAGGGAPGQAAAVSASVAEFGTVQVPVPAGMRVDQMVAAGDRIVLRLSGGGPERVLVIDPGQGRVAGSFVLSPEPAVR